MKQRLQNWAATLAAFAFAAAAATTAIAQTAEEEILAERPGLDGLFKILVC